MISQYTISNNKTYDFPIHNIQYKPYDFPIHNIQYKPYDFPIHNIQYKPYDFPIHNIQYKTYDFPIHNIQYKTYDEVRSEMIYLNEKWLNFRAKVITAEDVLKVVYSDFT